MPDSTTTALLSAILAAPTAQVVDVLAICTPEDVGLVDAPTATALEVAHDLAKQGTAPAAVVLDAELLRRGAYAGHKGELVRDRMVDATVTPRYPEMLPELAAAVLSIVFRARCTALGEALTAGADTAPESDLWQLLTREGAKARRIWDRIARTRGEVVA